MGGVGAGVVGAGVVGADVVGAGVGGGGVHPTGAVMTHASPPKFQVPVMVLTALALVAPTDLQRAKHSAAVLALF